MLRSCYAHHVHMHTAAHATPMLRSWWGCQETPTGSYGCRVWSMSKANGQRRKQSRKAGAQWKSPVVETYAEVPTLSGQNQKRWPCVLPCFCLVRVGVRMCGRAGARRPACVRAGVWVCAVCVWVCVCVVNAVGTVLGVYMVIRAVAVTCRNTVACSHAWPYATEHHFSIL